MSKIVRLLLCLPVLLLSGAVYGHDVEVPVIVDTDAGADDIRAISMLLNMEKSGVRLIATSDGVMAPEEGKKAILKLLNYLEADGIEVAVGKDTAADPPPFHDISASLTWPSAGAGAGPAAEAAAAIEKALGACKTRAIYLCLGPMTNLAAVLSENAALADNILRVIYLGGAPGSAHPGWNTERDPEAAAAVFGSGVPVYALAMPDTRYLSFDAGFNGAVCAEASRAAQLICESHSAPAVQAHMQNSRMRIWDEMAVVFLNRPDAFEFEDDPQFPECRRLSRFDAAAVRKTYLRLLGNPADFHLDARSSVVLKRFPVAPDLFRSDVAPRIEGIIAAHGEEEWKACLLTNELHRHLGIYSLVGAKMGIYAREMLGAPFDTLEVVSFAGSGPPLSCLNDGLQVATGASLGRGTITVARQGGSRPAAVFIYKNTALTLTLKPSYVEKVKSDIRTALERFGTTSPAYFAYVRELSLRYWLELDRTRMFSEDWQIQKNV